MLIFKNEVDVKKDEMRRLPNGIYVLSEKGVKRYLDQHKIQKEPYYKERKKPDGTPYNEKKIFESCFKLKIPLLLKGPTGTGKTRFLEHMAYEFGLPLITVLCNEDTSATNVIGMILPIENQIWWKDGPLSITVRGGGICYFDEIIEARPETIALTHSVTDYRRILPLDKTGEVLHAPDNFMFVASYNPQYVRARERMKQSTKQRFVAIEFGWPTIEEETEIIMKETGADRALAKRLAEFANSIRESKADTPAIEEAASTRTLVRAAQLIETGLKPIEAVTAAVANVITADDVNEDEKRGVLDIIEGTFK